VPSLLLVERFDSVALVTLNRPEKRNALSIDLRFEAAEAFNGLAADDDVACAVLTGAGPAFCSGMDTTQFGGDRRNREQLVQSSTAAFSAVGRFPKPLIAAVNGPAVAGGFALSLMCDMRVAAQSARFGFPELPRGIPPAYGAARAALGPQLARELCLTGRMVESDEALRRGIVLAVHPDGELRDRALELAAQVAAVPAFATLETKRRILIERERIFGPLFEEEERVFSEALLGGG
jgi:3-hydroxypropionyl-coenzyme A dehydratase